MALNDESFYNVFGEEVSRGKLVEQMISYYQLKLGIGETSVTDFNEGSEIRNLLESIAVDLYILMQLENQVTKQAFVDTATGEWLDKIGMQPFVQLPRNKGTVAKGTVTFSLPNASVTEYIIPMDTILVNENTGLYYHTTGECLISVGETNASVGAECLTVGSDGNCESDTLTIINDDYITDKNLTVTNPNVFEEGTDYEEDWLYRERLLDFVRKDDFGSMGYYTGLAESVTGVHDVLFVPATGFTKKILVNGDVKPTPEGVLLDVLTLFTDTENIVLTHSFTVDRPVYVSNDLTVNVTVGNEMDESVITGILTDFFDGGASIEGFELDGVRIGESVSRNDLYGLFELIDNVIGVEILVDGVEVSTLNVMSDEVLSVGEITVNQTIME